jgi:hypothetical protein
MEPLKAGIHTAHARQVHRSVVGFGLDKPHHPLGLSVPSLVL